MILLVAVENTLFFVWHREHKAGQFKAFLLAHDLHDRAHIGGMYDPPRSALVRMADYYLLLSTYDLTFSTSYLLLNYLIT